jgi:hypothetical protein
MEIDPSTLRLLWSVVDSAQNRDLLLLSDTALATMLLHRVSERMFLTGQQSGSLQIYIRTKLLLIREMDGSR